MEKTTPPCRYLRAKNAFGTLEGGDQPFLPGDPGTTTYWCIRTMGPAGPDDGLTHITNCRNEKRGCYAAPREKEEKK